MRVTIKAELFGCSAHSVDIITLMKCAYDGRCAVVIDPPYIPQHPDQTHPASVWLDRQSQEVRDFCEIALASGVEEEARHPSSREVIVEAGVPSTWSPSCSVLSARDALDFLQRPFEIYVENSGNDRAFILAVSRPEQRRLILSLEQRNRIRFVHAGGIGEMLRMIRDDILPHPQTVFNSWVLFDRDTLQPGQVNRIANRLVEACEDSVNYHQLGRRAIENYIPKKLLFLRFSRSRFVHAVAALIALSDDQRLYYNMKGGFARDRRRNDGLSAGNLYDGLSDHALRMLEYGFGDDVCSCFAMVDDEMEAWFAEDGQDAEIQPMLNQLLSLL